MRTGARRSFLAWLTIATVLAGCGTASPSRAPTTPLPTQAPAPTLPSMAPSPSPSSSPPPTQIVAGWPSVSGSGIEMTGAVESSEETDGRLRLSITVNGLVPGESVTLHASGTYRLVWNCGVSPEPCGELGCGPTDWSETRGTAAVEAKVVAGNDGSAQARIEIAASPPGEACPSDPTFPWGAQTNEWDKVTVADAAHGLLLTPGRITWGYTF